MIKMTMYCSIRYSFRSLRVYVLCRRVATVIPRHAGIVKSKKLIVAGSIEPINIAQASMVNVLLEWMHII